MTLFTNTGLMKEKLAFASPYPGKIIPINLSDYDGKIICQKNTFLCAAKGVPIGVDFRKKLEVGFFWWRRFYNAKVRRKWISFYTCRWNYN